MRQFLRVFMATVLLSSGGVAFGITFEDIQLQVGAGAFYSQGYTGSGVVVGNIEAGHPLTTHEVIDQSIQHTFELPGLPALSPQNHATAVVGTIVADDAYNNAAYTFKGTGIAPGATLWSGRIATTTSGSSFSTTENSVLWPLMVMANVGVTTNGAGLTNYTVGGADPRRVDVINSSWGYLPSSSTAPSDVENWAYDVAGSSGATVVVAAGNQGPTGHTVGSPANSYNVIAVGATSGSGPSEQVAFFSSRGPVDTFGVANSRTKPDIVAPGTSIDVPMSGSTTQFGNASGTSFASPVVAGGAALMIEEGRANNRSTDPRLIKAVLLNSADKLAGWTQNAVVDGNGTLVTGTPLDINQGAGRLNLNEAYRQYTSTSGDGTGTGYVNGTGWDTNTITSLASNHDYVFDLLGAGTTFTATLDWFIHRGIVGFNANSATPFEDILLDGDNSTDFFNYNLDDLDLLFYKSDALGNTIGDPIAISGSFLDNVEHIHLVIPETSRYLLRVHWFGEIFDFANTPDEEFYAVAWSGTVVPEPATLLILCVAGALLRRRRR